MKRVGGLVRHIAAGMTTAGRDGLTPQRQLAGIREPLQHLLVQAQRLFIDDILPQLRSLGVEVCHW